MSKSNVTANSQHQQPTSVHSQPVATITCGSECTSGHGNLQAWIQQWIQPHNEARYIRNLAVVIAAIPKAEGNHE